MRRREIKKRSIFDMNRNKINKNGKPEGEAECLPRHIGIIMDGNGRWAKKRLLPRSVGHRFGAERMMGLLRHALDRGVAYVTVYALSTENFSRPEEELQGLFDLIRNRFVPCMREIAEKKARVKVLGDLSLFPDDVRELLIQAQEETAAYTGRGVNVALGYGARAEIVRAANIAVKEGRLLSEKEFSDLLYTGGQPDPDLIIRTGKELRLSNFLLFQSAYAELYFSDKLFPDFSNRDLDAAIKDFAGRKRRFGKTDEQCGEEPEKTREDTGARGMCGDGAKGEKNE